MPVYLSVCLVLSGPGVESEHCIMESLDGNVILHPLATLCHVNGETVAKPTRLKQG